MSRLPAVASLAAAAALLAGCSSTGRTPYAGIFVPGEGGVSAPGVPAADAERHDGAWTWEELAVRAGVRSDAAKVAAIDAAIRRLRANEDRAWKDPELRLGRDSDDTSERRSDGRFSDGDRSSTSAGVRLYVPNPFVERYERAKGAADVRRAEARAALESYEVYCEVKTLCLAESRARAEERCLRERAEALDGLRRASGERLERGVQPSPLDAIRAEAKYRRVRLRLDETVSARRSLLRRIAWLADVPEEGLEIAEPALPPPDPGGMAVDQLAEIAFARRPDLAAAIAELDEAEASVRAARTAWIPWFQFVEAAYSRGDGHEDELEWTRTDNSDGMSLKAALSIPIFTWTGGSVSLNRLVRDRADERLRALYLSIRREIRAAYEDYRDASARADGEDWREFVGRMERRIAEYAESGAAQDEEMFRAKDELADCRGAREEVLLARAEAALRLESVVGGPLPTSPPPPPDPPSAEETSAFAQEPDARPAAGIPAP